MASRIFFYGVAIFLITLVFFYLSIASPYVQLIWWWDIPMHVFGGVWAGFIAAWFIVLSGGKPDMLQVVGFALFCGLAVELLEYASGFGVSVFMHPALDTAKDFIMDALGGYAAYASAQALRAI